MRARATIRTLICTVGGFGLVGCSANKPAPQTPPPVVAAEVDQQARYATIMARENGPFALRELVTPYGKGMVEAATPLKTECSGEICNFRVELGKDQDGDDNQIVCGVGPGLDAFGQVMMRALDEGGLEEMPVLEVREMGAGLGVSVVANVGHGAENGRMIGTMKVAVLYTQSLALVCGDTMPGGRKTFARVIDGLFQSFEPSVDPSALLQVSFRERRGDRVAGFSHRRVFKPGEGVDAAFAEEEVGFRLETNGKSWEVFDLRAQYLRDARGRVHASQLQYVQGATEGLSLTSRDAEDGKLRIKLEQASKSDSIELTPRAPIDTLLWASADIAKLVQGKLKQVRYGWVDVNDGEPSLSYQTIVRQPDGTIVTRADSHAELLRQAQAKGKPASGEVKVPDELQVDERGMLVKRVSTEATYERVHLRGDDAVLRTAGKKAR